MGRAWALSVGFHALVVGCLACFPAMLVVASSPGHLVSQGRARQVADRLRERQMEPLSESLRELREIETAMSELEQGKREEFIGFARNAAAEGKADAASLQDAVTSAQQQMVDALDSSTEDLEHFIAMRSNASFDRLLAAHELVRERQAKVATFQEQALGILTFCGNQAEAAQAQKAAIDAQAKVGEILQELDEARDTARGSRQRTPDERQYDHYTYHLARAERSLAGNPGELEEIGRRTAVLEGMAARLEKEIEEASGEDGRKLQAQMATVRAEYLSLGEKKNRLEKDLANASETLPKWKSQASEVERSLALAPQDKTADDIRLQLLHARTGELQKKAWELQKAAADALAHSASSAGFDPGILAALNQGEVPHAASPSPTDKDPQEVYRQAVLAERDILATYHRHRAMELSMIRRIPLDHSLEMTGMPKSERPDLSPALDVQVASADDLGKTRDALQRARDEMNSMVHAGRAMLSQARSKDDGAGSTITFEGELSASHQWELMQAPAGDGGEGRIKDLTSITGGVEHAWGTPGEGDGASGNPGGMAGNGTGSGVPGAGESYFLPGGPGGPPAIGKAGEGFSVPAMPGRTIASRGPSLPWVFVDSWYILGPFDNARRANIDTRFPPETVVDLNATYPGKNGVTIGWEFFQSGTPNVMPPFRAYNEARKIDGLSAEMSYRYNLQYAIYYAYTELRFEEETDLWIAVGSDDHSKIWINDRLIWESGKASKAWSPSEGYRKIHFQAGVNRVLYRIENGNDRTEFSLMIGMKT